MNYIFTKTSEVKSLNIIRYENPNMSIPDGADLSDLGYFPIFPAMEVPSITATQQLISGPPIFLADKWRETYLVEELPTYVPQQITRAQGKAALIVQGLWGSVLSYVGNIPDPVERALAEVALHDTLNWERNSPFLTTAAKGLGMSSEDLDNLFIAASQIRL